MGGISFGLSLVTPIADPKALAELHEELWALARERMGAALQERQVAQKIFTYYLSTVAYDGLHSGHWNAFESELSFSFDDGGGNCYPEMYASYHWAVRAFETAFDDARQIAGRHGTALAPLEYGAGSHVFFYVGGALAAAVAEQEPPSDHQIWLRDPDRGPRATTLAELPADVREHARRLIVEDVCECEMCRTD